MEGVSRMICLEHILHRASRELPSDMCQEKGFGRKQRHGEMNVYVFCRGGL